MMNMGTEVFRSRFARRLFALFILSSVLPVLALAILSFDQVTGQLLEQNRRTLHQETKAIGMAVFERLLFLETELQLAASQLALSDQAAASALTDSLKGRLKQKFSSLAWASDHQFYLPLMGNSDHQRGGEAINNRPSATEDIAIITLREGRGQGRLFMVKPFNLNGSVNNFLVGELDTRYLWNAEVLSGNQSLCVLDHLNRVLFCSTPVPDRFISQLGEAASHSAAGQFEWTQGNNDHLASYWSIFLKNRFAIGDWTVALSSPKEVAFQPITNFQHTFVAVVILTVLIVLMLSTNQIRRTLIPLKKLTEGIHNIGNIDFDSRVIIDSNDEFADLATSFNGMSLKLAQQFQSLETMADIDRLILSSRQKEAMIPAVLTRIQDIIRCDQISIAMPDSAGRFNTIDIRTRDEEATQSAIDFLPEDNRQLCDNRQGLIIEFNRPTPGYLAPVAEQGAKTCLVLPLFLDDRLAAIIAFGYRDRPDNAAQALHDTRSWVDRIAVALDKARWQE